MAIILNIETATEICSVAIAQENQILSLQENEEPFTHAASISLLIRKALEQANISQSQLNGVAISSGPGSYTALRVGTSIAKGICYALSIPLIEISTLQALASACTRFGDERTLYFPMIDARRMEVYTACYSHNNKLLSDVAPLIVEADSFNNQFALSKTICFCGNGAPKCMALIQSPLAKFCDLRSSAKHMVTLAHQAVIEGKFVDLAYFSPNYIKAPNITTPKKRL